jgi:hypothetical protein
MIINLIIGIIPNVKISSAVPKIFSAEFQRYLPKNTAYSTAPETISP